MHFKLGTKLLSAHGRLISHLPFCSGLNTYLDKQGFSLVGYGCTTCIGNSGDIAEELVKAITENGEKR